MSCMVKICGINSEDAAIAAMSAGADALGYVFFPPSPRHISLKGAKTLTERVPNSIYKVGLKTQSPPATLMSFSFMARKAPNAWPRSRNALALRS